MDLVPAPPAQSLDGVRGRVVCVERKEGRTVVVTVPAGASGLARCQPRDQRFPARWKDSSQRSRREKRMEKNREKIAMRERARA